nr:hypothetical protein [uncultured bacterium]
MTAKPDKALRDLVDQRGKGAEMSTKAKIAETRNLFMRYKVEIAAVLAILSVLAVNRWGDVRWVAWMTKCYALLELIVVWLFCGFALIWVYSSFVRALLRIWFPGCWRDLARKQKEG